MNAALITFALAILQTVGDAIAKGQEADADALAALLRSDAALAVERAAMKARVERGQKP